MKLIGLCGYARVGKDTAAKHMPGWQRFAFADELKDDLEDIVAKVTNNPLRDKERLRPLYVAWGAVARSFDPDFWVERLWEQIDISGARQVVITDVRYLNEAEWVTEQGGKVVYIERPGHNWPANAEESASIDGIVRLIPDLPVVKNDGTPEELGRKVLEVAG